MSEDQQPSRSGAARPTGKRQLSGASHTSPTQASQAVRADKNEKNDRPGGGAVAFVPEVVTEMKKVVWPTAKEMVQYTIVVFAFLIVMTGLVWGVDTLVGLGVESVLTP